MPIDASIAMSGRPFQLDNPLDIQSKVATLRQLVGQQQVQQLQLQQTQRTQEQEQTLADLYKGNVNPDGTVNRQGVLSGAAQQGLGSKIPGMQKQFADADKATAAVGHVGAQTEELKWKVTKSKLESTGSALSSLLANPNVTHDDVIRTVVGLVQNGTIGADQGQQMVQALPGQPAQLRQFLVQKGMELVDASKRMELMAPKRTEVNDGKTTTFVDTNPYTNPQGPAPIKMQTTPGQDQSAATTIRGQNMVDARAKDANGIAQSAARTQIVEGPDGFVLVDKGTGQARPAMLNGTQVPGKSSMTEDQGKASGWLAQATNAWNNMNTAMTNNPGAARPGLGDAVGNIPLIGGPAGRMLTGSDRQKFNQAASSLSEALLRAATGAGVNKAEADQKIAELTPQFGNDDATVNQKMAAIPIYIESLKMRAGPGAKKAAAIVPDNTAVPADIAVILKKHGGK